MLNISRRVVGIFVLSMASACGGAKDGLLPHEAPDGANAAETKRRSEPSATTTPNKHDMQSVNGLVIEPATARKATSFDQVFGAAEAKRTLREFIDTLGAPDKYSPLGARVPRGILMVGPPGTGKTMLARATADEAKATLFTITGTDLVMGSYGVNGADFARLLFEAARKHAPSIIFIDEIDALSEAMAKQLGTELDGMHDNQGVYVLAACNSIATLPPSLLRAGRFDRTVWLPLPDARTRAAMLRHLTAQTRQAADVNFDHIALIAVTFSGADIVNLVNMAGLRAAAANRAEVMAIDWEEAILDATLGPVDPSQNSSVATAWRTAVHEAGHAVVGILLPGGRRIYRATIVARGNSLGHTSTLPIDSAFIGNIAQYEADIAGALGGQAAESVVFAHFDPGARSDLVYASAVARRLVTEWGMGPETGAVDLSDINHSWNTSTFADATHQSVDAQVHTLVNGQLAVAKELLTDNKAALLRVARALVACRTLTGPEIGQLVAGETLSHCESAPEAVLTAGNSALR